MDWDAWHKQYEILPSLQARLRTVREQIVATLNECPLGPIHILSICAGDGRDLIGALLEHPRRKDVTAALLDNHAESIERGRAAAAAAGLGWQIHFIEADATRACNYEGLVPADLVLLSGFLGHLRHKDVFFLVESLPMFCKTGGWMIWNRHLVIHDGGRQVPLIRESLRKTGFEEVHFEAPLPDGFAVGRCRFAGRVVPLDSTRILFEFAGLDSLATASSMTEVTLSRSSVEIAGLSEMSPQPFAEYSWGVEQTICERFEQVVALHASRTAISSDTWKPTYAELAAMANGLAHTLIGLGTAPGDRVALPLRHDGPLVASILAVLKAGGMVVVLNPGDPAARLRQILEDAKPVLILTDETNRKLAMEIAARALKVVCFEEHSSGSTRIPQVKIAPQDLAFLIYTSGSTGCPKAVMQSHRNVVFNARRLSRGMEIRPEDHITLLASPSGGQGVATVWCALLNGATLCPFPPLEEGISRLADWMVRQEITVYVSAPSLFRPLVKTFASSHRFPKVRLVRLGSESASYGDFAACQKHFSKKCVLFLTLSCSEVGNMTQLRLTRHDAVAEGRLPVGFPADGIEILLLDEQGRKVPEGKIGEIAVRGRYLSPGYWHDDSLTAKRFSKNDDPKDLRLFLSGDRAWCDGNGLLWFAGREDSRVKVHGYRVELSEIEEVLARQPQVERSLVVARPLPGGDTQLVAYIIPRTNGADAANTLRQALRATLPGHMVPAAFVFLEDFPLTPHGKIDRQALLPPSELMPLDRCKGKARDMFEAILVKIWESVLGIAPIGRRDDFFELGGTSLQSLEVLLRVEERLDILLPPSVLVEHSTIERLAAVLAKHAISSPNPLVPLRADGEGQPLFLIHTGQGDVVSYAQLARRLPDRPIYGLQSVGLQGEAWPLMSISAMARRYLPEILARDPTGPYLLGAACMGGMVAFELAQLLVHQGREVGLLALLDVPHPLPAWKHHDWVEQFYGTLRDPVRDAFRILRWAVTRAAGLGRSARRLPAYRRFVAHMNSRANRSYKPAFYPGTLTLFATADTKFPCEDLRFLMCRHARTVQIITIPGVRSGLFLKPAVDELAQQLQRCMDSATPKTATRQSDGPNEKSPVTSSPEMRSLAAILS